MIITLNNQTNPKTKIMMIKIRSRDDQEQVTLFNPNTKIVSELKTIIQRLNILENRDAQSSS